VKKYFNTSSLLIAAVILLGLSVTIYSEAQRSRSAIERLFDAIQPSIAQSLAKSNYLGLHEISRALVASHADSIEIYDVDSAQNLKMVWSYPNLIAQTRYCAVRYDGAIRHQGLQVGRIESCFAPLMIVKRALLAPSALVYFVILSGVIVASGAIGNLRLRRKILELSAKLEDWGKKAVCEPSIPDLEFGTSDVEQRLGKHTRRLVEELTETKLRAREHEAIARTTQSLAHDVRKPFSMLKMVLDAVSEADDPIDSRQIAIASLPEVNEAIASVEGMIQDVMQIGSNSMPNQEVASPESVVDAALNEVFRISTDAQVGIAYELKHVHSLFVDTLRVGRVFTNILVNAVQAINGQGNIWIKTIEKDGFIEFRIGNAGSFIPKESLPNLFEAFFTSGKKGGTGLGLAIAHKIVNDHGGSIRCESKLCERFPSGFVEFIFTLPSSREQSPEHRDPLPSHSRILQERFLAIKSRNLDSASSDELELEKVISSTLKRQAGRLQPILIIDDEAVYRNSLWGLIANFRGGHSELVKIPIVFASSSEEAFFMVQQQNPFLIIQDVDLGAKSKSGIEVIKELRSNGYRGHVCIHSNRFLYDDQKTATEAGADSVLPKPMSRVHLFKLIADSLSRSSKPKLTILGNIESPKSKPRIAYVDDSMTFTLSWKLKLKDQVDVETFASTSRFFEKIEAEPNFLQSLDVIVTDFYFGADDPLDGRSFAVELRKMGYAGPIYLASNGDFSQKDLQPYLSGVIGKDIPDIAKVSRWIENAARINNSANHLI
jgi:signal transduction histidine kinase/CheY-like chemotaxis protein